MASNVTRDHHNLRRNLKLNDNYISNDGGDEGIRITDAGLVGIGVTDPDSLLEIFGTSTQLKLSHNADDYATFTVADTGDLTIATVGDGAGDSDLTLDVDGDCIIDSVVTNIRQSGVDVIEFAPASNRIQIRDMLDVNDYLQFTCLAATSGSSTITTVDGGGGHSAYLTLRPDGYLDLRSYGWSHSIAEASGEPITMASGTFVHIDKDLSNTTASSAIKGLHVDVDRTGDVSTGTDTAIGIDLDVTHTGASGGTIGSIGLDIDVVGDSGGTSKTIGLQISVASADTNYAMITSGGNVGIGVDDPASLLEVFGESAQLKLSWDASNYADISVADDGHLELATTGTDGDITLDADGDIFLQPADGSVTIEKGAGIKVHFDLDSHTLFTLNSLSNISDYFSIQVNAEGATEISTVDADSAVGHLSIGADGHVEFDGCAVGFDKETTTFAASAVLSEGDDSTDIDFRLGNKHELTLTDDIAGSGEYINMIFPATSGNFILVLIQGVADCTVATTGWRAYQSDGSTLGINTLGLDAVDGRIRWAGGTPPTLSTAQYDVDVVSFYWEANNGTALGVVSLDFG